MSEINMNKEEKETFELLIVREKGSTNVITEVENYGVLPNNPDVFYYIKNGWRGFVPKQGVIYFGRRDLYC